MKRRITQNSRFVTFSTQKFAVNPGSIRAWIALVLKTPCAGNAQKLILTKLIMTFERGVALPAHRNSRKTPGEGSKFAPSALGLRALVVAGLAVLPILPLSPIWGQEEDLAPIFRRDKQPDTPAGTMEPLPEPGQPDRIFRPETPVPEAIRPRILQPEMAPTAPEIPAAPENSVPLPSLVPGNAAEAARASESPSPAPSPPAPQSMPGTPATVPGASPAPAPAPAPEAPELQPRPEPTPAPNPKPIPRTNPQLGPMISPPSSQAKTKGPGFHAGLATVKGARILTLSIPAPRGQIVDRWGAPMAQNRVVYYLGLNFPYMENKSDADKVGYARRLLDKANQELETNWTLEEADILKHYKSRRWLPLIFTKLPLTEAQIAKIREMEMPGLILHPTYQRLYPQGMTAGHIVGYVGKRAPWPKGEVPDGEPMWPTAQGVSGLELAFDAALTGRPGRVQIIFNEKGQRVEETVVNDPVPGYNIVTTLDLDMQRLAERILSEKVHRGACVIMDVRNGDVLALASYPNFDPNLFIPRISTDEFAKLRDDPAKPMLGRAFQGAYPPASTLKVSSALSLLETGTVNEYSLYSCPKSFTLNDRTAHNWAKYDEGVMNVVGALARSCNTWFYQAALDSTASNITAMAGRLGFGRKTGILLQEEHGGFIPTNEWSRAQYGHNILGGDLMNIVIGQGSVESTPVQVAQAMAAVGNRQYLNRARLVLQMQDVANRIVDAYDVDSENLNISQHSLNVVHKGMYEVVNGSRGTGKQAAHARINISGKTGTGQWKPAKAQNIAWFAGFAPSEYPVYSFAVVYEGDPGEKVGGGSKAAPVIGEYFKEYLTEERLDELQDISRAIKVRMREENIEVGSLKGGTIFRGGGSNRSSGSDTAPPPPTKEKKKKKKGGFFKNIFGSAD